MAFALATFDKKTSTNPFALDHNWVQIRCDQTGYVSAIWDAHRMERTHFDREMDAVLVSVVLAQDSNADRFEFRVISTA